jgi:hypothetical protein
MYTEDADSEKRQQPSDLDNCYVEFMLSRQAILCTPRWFKDFLTG